MFSKGFRVKLGLVIALGIGVTLVLIHAGASNLTSTILLGDEKASLQKVGDVLASTLVALAHDEEELRSALSNAKKDADLESIQVLNHRFETVAPRGGTPAEVLLGRQLLDELSRNRSGVSLVRSPVLGDVFALVRPIVGGGYLFLALSAKGYEAKQQAILGTMVVWGSVILMAMFLFGIVLFRAIVKRPIERLLHEAGEVATGRGQFAESVEGEDFGVLKESLRSMAKRLKSDRARIESQVSELEHMNRQLLEAQEQLIRTEKLASVGQLAAGMAHEIGNPIGIVLGYLDMLTGDQLDLEQRNRAHEQIRLAIQRVDAIIKDILNFSRPALDEEATSDVVQVVESVVTLLRPQKRFNQVEISMDVEVDQGTQVAIPPSRFKQVLLNLLFNASDAMEGKGQIGVSIKRAGEEVRLTITDSGPGIPEDLLLKVFDPFFTTKEVGAGTGLGLFVCHTLVNRYSGAIEVSNAPEMGARFTLQLPTHKATDKERR